MMESNNGYVILASTAEQQRAAALCAYSIKIQNKEASVTMLIPKLSNLIDDYEEPFDMIVELPFPAEDTLRANDWQLYWASPYENTIALDCYTVVKENQESLWEYLISHHDMAVPTVAKTIQDEYIAVYINDPANVYNTHSFKHIYSNVIFFKKNEATLAYFKLLDPYMRNWRTAMSRSVEPRFVTDKYNSDLIHSIAVWHLDLYEDISTYHKNIFNLIDIDKGSWSLLNRKKDIDNWTGYLNSWISNSAKLKIQNFAITGTFYYRHPDFNTTEIYDGHRNYFRELELKTKVVDKV